MEVNGEWWASRTASFMSGARWIEGSVGPGAALDAKEGTLMPLLWDRATLPTLVSRLQTRGSLVIKALDYKPEGYGFETRP
jgi:hypothetical protein